VPLAWIGEDYRPEPDVLVMDADLEHRERFIERAYVLARNRVGHDPPPCPPPPYLPRKEGSEGVGEKEPWIAIKRGSLSR
jgi:hypothetical protein